MPYISRWFVITGLAAALMLIVQAQGAESGATNKTATGVSLSSEINQKTALANMKRVADWQLANPSAHPATDWTQGAYYAGMMALASISDDPKYHDAMMAMAEENHWKPSTNLIYHADNYCVLQTYLELYLQHHDSRMLEPAKQRCDQIMATPPKDENDLDFAKPNAREKWVWCDALFMSPPVWTRLFAATGDKKYLDFMNERWWRTSDHLYDKQEHLYYRDDRFLTKREANGQKVFWCRGNGWVLGALVRVLQYLPADYPDRPRYVAQFKELAARLVKLQGQDGLWRPSLLDPDSFPAPESSGSGFILYGLAWGVNQKLLARADYEPAIRKGWQGLVHCVEPNGRLGFVQPIGANAASLSATNSEVYGVGAFLLAGSEIYRLTGVSGAPLPPGQ
jgi:unsaturated rhamnogalacturonyl hydrolase